MRASWLHLDVVAELRRILSDFAADFSLRRLLSGSTIRSISHVGFHGSPRRCTGPRSRVGRACRFGRPPIGTPAQEPLWAYGFANAPAPARLPYAYIVRQLQDFRLGLRRSSSGSRRHERRRNRRSPNRSPVASSKSPTTIGTSSMASREAQASDGPLMFQWAVWQEVVTSSQRAV
jgi:hypothetical protein